MAMNVTFGKIACGMLAAGLLPVSALAASSNDSAVAIRSLETVARMSPGDGGAAVELAAAYQRAGRAADANTAFRRALTLDNMMLETPTGDAVWSHQVARQALARDTALTAR